MRRALSFAFNELRDLCDVIDERIEVEIIYCLFELEFCWEGLSSVKSIYMLVNVVWLVKEFDYVK